MRQLRAAWEAAHPEHYHQRSLAWKRSHLRLRDPLQRRAHAVVARALRTGTLVRLPCLLCKTPRTVAHHPDYRLPFLVIWLCAYHHYHWHQGHC
jgi:hypothetical protein